MNHDSNDLELTIAEFFPQEYTSDNWQELVPRYIAAQMDIYPIRVEDYERQYAHWLALGRRGPEPDYPLFPVAFAQACAQEMHQQAFNYAGLAASLRLLEANYQQLEQSNEALTRLVEDSNQIGLELLEEVRQLNERVRSLEWNNHRLTVIHECCQNEIQRFRDGTRIENWSN